MSASKPPRPPRGFPRGTVWAVGPQELATGTPVPAARLGEAIEAMARRVPGGMVPYAGIVVLGVWLGGKPGDMSWAISEVLIEGDVLLVRFASEDDLVLRVGKPSDAVHLPGPYGDLLVVPTADEVLVTYGGRPSGWMPQVRAGQAIDRRGDPKRWPTAVSPVGGWRPPRHPIPAVALSVWSAGPLPAEMTR